MPHARAHPPQLLLRARATVGTRDSLLVSGKGWQAASGPIVEDSLYNGEIYDARRELKDSHGRHFSHQNYSTTAAPTWTPVAVTSAMPNTTKLVPQLMPPIQKIRPLQAKKISSPATGIHVIDFGQNTAGIVRMRIPRMTAGANLTIFHGELLNHPRYGPADGRMYTDNLRNAKARDVYISSGAEAAGMEWEPTFTQHGFRYIEIHGLKAAPRLHDFVAWEMRTSVLETGSFSSSSSALLNQIQSSCQRTARSNLMSLPTDCCQRDERRGWMGDAALGASVNFFNHEMTSFYDAFATLMMDDQGQKIDGDDEGAMPNWVLYSTPANPATSLEPERRTG